MVIPFRHIPCNLCGEDDFHRLGKPRISQKIKGIIPLPEDISVVKCNRCGFYYTDPMPFWRSEDLQSLYNSQYFPPMTRWWKHRRARLNPKRRLDAIEHYASSRISQFLEIGCGPGYGIEEAMRRGWMVHGEDVSQAFARQVKERLGIDIFLGKLEEAGYAESYFDAVYIDSVLEHIPEPAEMFQELHRILKPGGIAYIVVTNEDSLINEFRGAIFELMRLPISPRLSPLEYPYHLVGFNKHTFERTTESKGFEIKHIEVGAGTEEWRKQRDIRFVSNRLMYYPVYLLGQILGKGISIEAVIAACK